jgi:predicted RNA-binding Zn-ribbon protein involved in translation (DUF1610 family)
METTKKCPACAEEIQSAAVKCRYCGTILASAEWQRAVLHWRSLAEAERKAYWESLTSEQRETFNSVNSALTVPAPTAAIPTVQTTATTEGIIICPNPSCGYQGPPKRVARGSALVGCVLLLFFIVPGILYFMFKSGYRYICPRCGLQIRSDN